MIRANLESFEIPGTLDLDRGNFLARRLPWIYLPFRSQDQDLTTRRGRSHASGSIPKNRVLEMGVCVVDRKTRSDCSGVTMIGAATELLQDLGRRNSLRNGRVGWIRQNAARRDHKRQRPGPHVE
jgi:hypothetical protein